MYLIDCFLSIWVNMNGGIVEGINNKQYLTVHLVIIISICIVTQNTSKKIWSDIVFSHNSDFLPEFGV